jgi:hypothetical protein
MLAGFAMLGVAFLVGLAQTRTSKVSEAASRVR